MKSVPTRHYEDESDLVVKASYGRLRQHQLGALTPHVRDRSIHDLGAGACTMAMALLDVGAASVVCVDKFPIFAPHRRGLSVVAEYFSAFRPTEIDVAFVSWPMNHHDAELLRLVTLAKRVAYLGKNTDLVACGFHDLFEHFLTRPILTYSPDVFNTLIVYGEASGEVREPRGEEHGGLGQKERALSYNEVERRPSAARRADSRRP